MGLCEGLLKEKGSWAVIDWVLFQEGVLQVKTSDALPPLRNPDILVGENDLTSLSYLHEPAGETVTL